MVWKMSFVPLDAENCMQNVKKKKKKKKREIIKVSTSTLKNKDKI